jgi:hypothetical protein
MLIFVATDRGELRLYRFQTKQSEAPPPIWRRDIDMDVRSCTITAPPRSVLLLGGSDSGGQACIRELHLRQRGRDLRGELHPLWQDAAPRGQLRMLVEVVTPAGKKPCRVGTSGRRIASRAPCTAGDSRAVADRRPGAWVNPRYCSRSARTCTRWHGMPRASQGW